MRLLLDTHIFLWYILKDARLPLHIIQRNEFLCSGHSAVRPADDNPNLDA